MNKPTLPSAGGSYTRDADTGELTPVAATKPAPVRGENPAPAKSKPAQKKGS